ncbi:ATP-binding protein [uncultured Dubosiella sp.]|uniref:ATP/GTP-binding protein n=1 Tax=uncultured Dubosiella sp. TaxID=1937011 RepID=UPI0025923EE8|nr:ATP-binding protein [uncultured Dubosiella sp.]
MKKIVLTGGPCAGKTTALPILKQRLEQRGMRVALFQEIATEVLEEGISPSSHGVYAFQKEIFERQRRREDAEAETADLLLLDRGLMDHKAYLPATLFERLLHEEGESCESLLGRYDGVLVLQTVAGHGVYRKETNAHRLENAEEASAMDQRFVEAWCRHPGFVRIEAMDDFEQKINRMEEAIIRI